MAKCPRCGTENRNPTKIWKFGIFTVNVYTCDNCKTHFKEYLSKNGKPSFYTLKLIRKKLLKDNARNHPGENDGWKALI